MKEYKQKYLWRSIFYSKGSLIFLILIIIFMMQKVVNIYLKYDVTKEALDLSKKEELVLIGKQNIGQNKLSEIDTAHGQEDYIRKVYPVKKEGEGVVIIYDVAPATYEIPKEKTIWEKIKEWYNDLINKL